MFSLVYHGVGSQFRGMYPLYVIYECNILFVGFTMLCFRWSYNFILMMHGIVCFICLNLVVACRFLLPLRTIVNHNMSFDGYHKNIGRSCYGWFESIYSGVDIFHML